MAIGTFTLTGNLTTYANLEKAAGYGSLIIRAIPDSMPVPAELETLVQPDPFPIASDGTFSIELDAVAGVRYRVSTSPRSLFPSFAFDALAAGETVDLSEVQTVPASTPTVPYLVGQRGPSAYEVAVADGFVGTEAEWLASLEGPTGPTGPPAVGYDSTGAPYILTATAPDGTTQPASVRLVTDASIADPNSVPGAFISSTFAVARRNTIGLIGDSITYANQYAGGILTFNLRGFWGSAARRLGQRFDVVAMAGVSGDTTTQMLARFDADITANTPGWVHILGGTNDVSGGATLSTIQSNLSAMIDKSRGFGARIILGTIPPNNNIPTSDARYKIIQQLNEWIVSLGGTSPDLTVIDYFTLLADPITGQYAANLTPTGDGTHPSAQGAARMGKALAAVLAPMVPPRNDLPTSNLDIPGRGLQRDNIAVGKPMMTGSTGSKGAGVTGTVADGWALNPAPSNTVTAVGSVEARTDGGPGNWQKIDVQAGSARLYGLNGNVGVHYNVGDQIYGECEMQSDAGWASVSSFRLRVMCLGSSNAQLVCADDFGWDNIADEAWAAETQPGADGVVVMRTPSITIPSGVTSVYVEIVAKLVGKVYVTRLAMRRIKP